MLSSNAQLGEGLDESEAFLSPYPLVSVIVSSYNQEGLVAEWVRSVQQQTYPNVEMIMVDDGLPYLPVPYFLRVATSAF
jgi:cellulose synthase/poly-beta-1,6-N-acetylglucosamine synthase-like glycosyltransferase